MNKFPDFTSDAGTANKKTDPTGTDYTVTDKDGYLLFGHDITGGDGATAVVNYINFDNTTMCYTIDVYRGKLPPTDRFLDFALYVAYFPQLVAGPIERPNELLPRIQNPRHFELAQIQRGLYLILLGLFKKVAIADGVAASVNSIYNSTGTVGALDVAAATLLFCVQVYCDFSAYSDIARGVSKLLGIDLVTNFRAPFFSRSPAEYWQRWHISLSTWLRDYLFMPLVFLDPRRRIYLALMITMLVGGLWHGASWNFVLWGGFHGLLLAVHAIYRDRWPAPDPRAVRRWRVVAGIALFFTINWYSFLLFRAGSFAQIVDFTTALATGAGGMHLSMKLPALSAMLGIPMLLGLDLFEYATGDALAYRRLPAWSRGALYAFLIFVIIMGTGNEPTEFIYFQF
ncbi:MAG: MBOAT family protein [Planctomycetes bacterium]|nr:MBOAT family protein [Planctomycetota bacterium]